MKRLLLICLLILVFPAVAQAQPDYFHTSNTKAYKLEARINSYRLSHGRLWLYHAANLEAAAYALNRANYSEGKYTTSIAGVPPDVWLDTYLSPQQQFFSAELRRIRCDSLPLTPLMVMDRWKRKKSFRFVLLNPLAASLGIHVAQFHRSKGDFKGLGECTLYTAVISS